MRRRNQVAAAGATAIVAMGFGTGAVVATGGDDGSETDTPISGAAKAQAEQAALDAVGEGTVTGTEVDDEESKYEVEVIRDNGTQVDVQLDEDFAVVGHEDDGAEAAEED
ncbi:MAG: hypothetical protein M3445_09065 [Actinomycetota bacterium]|jgi:hypothetical protein|nr:hypothetical protein [Actinomycetota bacterium]